MVNGEYYYTRKGDYAIKGLVICDDSARITWVEMGSPGSIHDNRIWVISEIYVDIDKYFDHKEYLLGDSAFAASAVMIPAFKKCHNSNLSEERRYLNTNLPRLGSRASIVLGYSRHGFNVLEEGD